MSLHYIKTVSNKSLRYAIQYSCILKEWKKLCLMHVSKTCYVSFIRSRYHQANTMTTLSSNLATAATHEGLDASYFLWLSSFIQFIVKFVNVTSLTASPSQVSPNIWSLCVTSNMMGSVLSCLFLWCQRHGSPVTWRTADTYYTTNLNMCTIYIITQSCLLPHSAHALHLQWPH